MANQKKQLTELSDEELKQVNGGAIGVIFAGCILKICNPGEEFETTPGICQCVPMPNNDLGVR